MPRLIVTGGRLDHRADVATAVWAFDILRYTDPHLRLVVTGDGPERDRLRRFAQAAGCDETVVRFATISPEDFPRAEQVWVPHRVGGERLALAALAAGVPVVAADTPELRDVVGDAGWYFPPGDRARLACVGRRLLDRPTETAAVGEAGRHRVIERFPAWRLADALAAVYHEAGVLPAS